MPYSHPSSGQRSESRRGSCPDKLESWPICTWAPFIGYSMGMATKLCGLISPCSQLSPTYMQCLLCRKHAKVCNNRCTIPVFNTACLIFYSLLWLEVHYWAERCHVFDFMSFTQYKSNKGVLEPWEQGLCLIRVASCLSLAFWTPGQHLARVHRTSSIIDVRA